MTFVLFDIGAHLGEIISDVKHGGADQTAIDALNRQYGNLREAIRRPQSELIEPVIDRFCDELSALAADSPELSAKTDALSAELRDIARRLVWDNEVPF